MQVSLHCFKTSPFICNGFGCKLWLQSIQNHATHRFQAFLHRHLKSLYCSIGIRADAPLQDSSSIYICCLAQDLICICSFALFLLRDQLMIERLSEAIGAALVDIKFLRTILKILFHMTKKSVASKLSLRSLTVTARKLQAIKVFLTLELTSTKSVSQEWQHFFLNRACRGPQRMQPTQNFRNALCLFKFVRPAQAVPVCLSAAPRAWSLTLKSKPSIAVQNSLGE